MEDRRASWIAAAFGSVAIGGLWLARPERQPPGLRVAAQWIPENDYGVDADAAVAFRVEARGALRELVQDARLVEYRLVDGAGGYNLVPMSDPIDVGVLKLPKGYPRDLRSPRLVAYINGVPSASTPIRPLPQVVRTPLVETPEPPIVLYSRSEGELIPRMVKPLPKNERWRVEVVRTPTLDVDAWAEIGPLGERWNDGRLLVPYGLEAGKAEVRLTRYRLVPRSENVRVPGIRLTRRFGGTALIVDDTIAFTTPMGAVVRIPMQDNGPQRQVRHGDSRTAVVNVAIVPPTASFDGEAPRRLRGPAIEILSPSPESLGLRELRFGGKARSSSKEPTRDVRRETFSLDVRLTYFSMKPVESFLAVVPVRPAPVGFRDERRYVGTVPEAFRFFAR